MTGMHGENKALRAWLPVLALLALAAGWLIPAGHTSSQPAAGDVISLAGEWQFQLDRDDAGVKARWFDRPLAERIRLPGALQAQGFGDPVSVDTPWTGTIVDRSWFKSPQYARYRAAGNVKVPFWLQPDRYYVGPAWFARTVELPAAWASRPLRLTLERPHWETQVWLDGQPLGSANSLSTPHVYRLSRDVAPGKHRLVIRVDNRLLVNVGENAHSVSDHTQGNWNGIAGAMTLEALPPVTIGELQVYPQIRPLAVRVMGTIDNAIGQVGKGTLTLRVAPIDGGKPLAEKQVEVTWTEKGGQFETTVPLGEGAQLWDEFQPTLYELQATLADGGSRSVRFGLREIGTQGTQFVLNGRKLCFRGTLECCIFPRTGHPPTDVAEWKRVLGVAKAHGLNHLRFHSWCPPEAAFVAADELGVYYQIECSAWAEVGKGKPIDRWLYDETDRILAAYGNHPSFVLLASGNEPGGNHQRYLGAWLDHYKKRDTRRLYTSASGWPEIPQNQYHVSPGPRIQAWGAGMHSRINALPPETVTDYRAYIRARTVPVISHEIGEWCVYPNFAEIPKYTGYLKARNFEIFRDSLTANHMADQARQFLLASGKLQTLCYKEDIEAILRTPGTGGFDLLDLHDFPGQGTALVGALDPFWESKGYVTADEYRRFCNHTVPLARLPKRVFTIGESLRADVEVAHFGPRPLPGCRTVWKLVDSRGSAVASGKLAPRDVPVDNGVALGRIDVSLDRLTAPACYRLVVGLEGTPFENDWDVWLYPATVKTEPPAGVTVATQWTPEARQALRGGGKVLLLAPPARIKGDAQGKPAMGFSSIFWNTAWTHHQPPHTLGILCDPTHPALAAFPTEYHSNWQWWYLISQAQPMILDALPARLRPLVQVIDDWFTNRRLGLVFEARVGGGKLLVSSIDLHRNADNPVARQMLHSLLAYLTSDRFDPAVELTAEQIAGLFAEPTTLQRLGARVVKVSSAEPGFAAEKAIDGDPATMWHSAFTPEPVRPPHEIQLDLGKPVPLQALTVLPRQDNNPNGRIRRYACYASDDGKRWGDPVAEGELASSRALQTIRLARPVTARYLRFVALSEAGGRPFASIAELDVVLDTKR